MSELTFHLNAYFLINNQQKKVAESATVSKDDKESSSPVPSFMLLQYGGDEESFSEIC